jgi:hypothetical protein
MPAQSELAQVPQPAARPRIKPKPRAAEQAERVAVETPTVQASQEQEVRSKRTRFADEPATAAQSHAANPQSAGNASFKGRIFEDVSVINSNNVRVRVLEDFVLNGCTIRRNTLLPAIARRSSQSVDIAIQSVMACGKRVSVNFIGYSLDGSQGLPVREDKAVETGAKEGSNELASGTAGEVASRATGMAGIIGGAIADGISSGVRASQQVQPVLVEEGREMFFVMN